MTLTENLELYVVIVVATLGNELVMGTILADFALFDEVSGNKVRHLRFIHTERHSHSVSILNRRKSMCNGDCCSSLGGLV